MSRSPDWLTDVHVDAVVAYLIERGTPMDVEDLGRAFGRSWSWAHAACVRAKRAGRVVRFKDVVGPPGSDVRAGCVPEPPRPDGPSPIERYLAREPRSPLDVAARFNLRRVADGLAMCEDLVRRGRATRDPATGLYSIPRHTPRGGR